VGKTITSMEETPMSDSRTATSDQTSTPSLLGDDTVGNLVATKFLNDVRVALTGPQDDPKTLEMSATAAKDLSNLENDPQIGAVFNAIIEKIENHDPSLGPLQGHVEKYPDGELKGFGFDNPQQEAVYTESLNKTMQQGYTRAEAVAQDPTPKDGQNRERGVLQLDFVDLYTPHL
jgi:hypothetical protein